MNFKTLKNATLAVAFSAFSAVLLSANAQAYQCKTGFTQVETIANTRMSAKASGRAAWTNTVKNAYGLGWSVWTIAASDSQTCQKTGNNWYCVSKAKPCMYVVQ